ncbi:hypothetical protein BDL97_17G008200 [Sphagnum fallax]|jgi:hypothetical protein|nr:hypothetical protein BDL97_17G008200 [Sphagnum fallax]
MATGSKQPAVMRMLMCMSLLVLVTVNMVNSVEASTGSRKMQATIDCNLRHLAHKDMQGDFNSVAGWFRNLVKPLYHHRSHERRNPDFAAVGIRAVCIPKTESLLEEHEGRHDCAYNKSDGSRAVGVGYNLDDDSDTRRSELSVVLADYDKVYKGEDCLNSVQISALLTVDTKRALDRAANSVASLDDQCCEVMAVFGDIQHSTGSDELEGKDFEDFVEAASAKKWKKAGKKLRQTVWCQKHRHRCEDDAARIRQGCDGISMVIDAAARA